MVLFALPLVAGLVMYDIRLNENTNALLQGKAADAKPAVTVQSEAGKPKVPALYFSPWCGYCEEPLREYVKRDPRGKTWQPVVVPDTAMSQGEALIRKMGYTGRLISAPKSPSGGFPCLQLPDGRLLVGRQEIMRILASTKGADQLN